MPDSLDDVFPPRHPILCIHKCDHETCIECQHARDMAIESERQRVMDGEEML